MVRKQRLQQRPLTLLALLLVLFPIHGFSEDVPWEEEAKRLNESDKAEEALQVYQAHPAETANYHYNIGTLLLRVGKVGPALAHLEKANRLGPHDVSIQHNLRMAQNSFRQLFGADRLDPSSSWVEILADRVSLDEVRAALGLLGFFVALLWARAYLKTRSLRKTLLQPSGLIGVFAFSLATGLYFIERTAATTPAAICVAQEIIRSGPGDHFLEMARLEAGTKVRVLSAEADSPGDSRHGWRQIRHSPAGVGWVRSSSLLLL